MAKKNGNGLLQPTPFNETTGGSGPQDYDESGAGLWGDLSEVMSAHLSQSGADLQASANMKSGAGIMGGPAPGEPNPVEFSGTAQSKGS
jgi:hypothetical protein